MTETAAAPQAAVDANKALIEALTSDPTLAAQSADAKKLFHRLGNWGIANVLKQNQGLLTATVADQMGDGNVDANSIAKLMEAVPFGSEINITNIGTGEPSQPDTGTAPAPVAPVQPEPVTPAPEPVRPDPIVQPVIQIPDPEPTPAPTPDPQPQPQPPENPSLLQKWGTPAAVGAAALLVGGLGTALWLRPDPTPPTPTPPAEIREYSGELSIEVPLNVERKKTNKKSGSETSVEVDSD